MAVDRNQLKCLGLADHSSCRFSFAAALRWFSLDLYFAFAACQVLFDRILCDVMCSSVLGPA